MFFDYSGNGGGVGIDPPPPNNPPASPPPLTTAYIITPTTIKIRIIKIQIHALIPFLFIILTSFLFIEYKLHLGSR